MDYVLKPCAVSEYFTLRETLAWVADGLLPSDVNIRKKISPLDVEEINYDVFSHPRSFKYDSAPPYFERDLLRSEFEEYNQLFNAKNEIIRKLVDGNISAQGNCFSRKIIRKKDWLTRKYLIGEGEEVYLPKNNDTPNFLKIDRLLYVNINIDAPVIEREKWLEGAVDWLTSSLDCGDERYEHIFLHKDFIKQEFPALELPLNLSAQLRRGLFIVPEDVLDQETAPETRGRPKATDWESFMCELARLQAKGELPDKQDATVSIMQKWCMQNSGTSPKESSLQAKISKFYKTIKQ